MKDEYSSDENLAMQFKEYFDDALGIAHTLKERGINIGVYQKDGLGNVYDLTKWENCSFNGSHIKYLFEKTTKKYWEL